MEWNFADEETRPGGASQALMRSAIDLVRALTCLFFRHFFDKEALSPQPDAETNVTQAKGLLAALGAFVA
jgi:hypothetical protein